MEEEVWKEIPEYEGLYEASTLGRIQSVDRIIVLPDGKHRHFHGKVLKSHPAGSGYLYVTLYKEHESQNLSVHRLVALTFLDRMDPDLEVNHKDGDRLNNKVENLDWVTKSQNIKHAFESGLNRISQQQIDTMKENLGHKVYCFDNDRVYRSMKECEEDLSISHEQLISSLKRNGKLTNRGKQCCRYRIVLLENKDSITYELPNQDMLFKERRISKSYKTGQLFSSSSEVCKHYNIEYSTAKVCAEKYRGYFPDLDDVIYDCGYDSSYSISESEYDSICHYGKRQAFKSITSRAVRCSNGHIYMSCAHAESCLNLSTGKIQECLRRNEGYLKDQTLHFEYVSIDEITDTEVDELFPSYIEKRRKLLSNVKRSKVSKRV